MSVCGHYYLIYKGELVGEDELYDFVDINTVQSLDGERLPTYNEIMDRRKKHAIHFKYCPLCGDKLHWGRFKGMADVTYKYK